MSMTVEDKIELTKINIRSAIRDYWAHTTMGHRIKDAISSSFVDKLAVDAVNAKENLRNLLRKSPQWNEELDAIVINGNSTHEPNYDRIRTLAGEILEPALDKADDKLVDDIWNAVYFFVYPNSPSKERYIESIKRIDDRAYAPGKKLSRVFKAICVALGVADETPGCDFQRKFAQIADEMSTRSIGFKLYLSINPAHFLTMSNPKDDNRGACLTSCHSFNSTEYEYNNGCVGYARDKVTMIAFTVADDNNPETLNNRKTTRQLFMYEPDSGLLLQSRMYNTSGGTYGAQEESKLYRDLVERELSACENAMNYWKVFFYADNKYFEFPVHEDFGGYQDWIYEDYKAVVCVRKDRINNYHVYEIGAAGLCVHCGRETSDGLFCHRSECSSYENDMEECDCCGYEYDRDSMYEVTDENGDTIYVCRDCYDEHYTACDECNEYHHEDYMYPVYDRYGDEVYVCENCRDNYYEECEVCGEYHHVDTMEQGICETCREQMTECDICGHYHDNDEMTVAYENINNEVRVCEECLSEHFEECKGCHNYHRIDEMVDGYCPNCLENMKECPICHHYFCDYDMNTVTNINGVEIEVCDNCLEKEFEECTECGEFHHKKNIANGICLECIMKKAENELNTNNQANEVA